MSIQSMIAQGEGQRLEFKESFALEKDIIITLCAFANAEGGTLLVGVRDDGAIIGAQTGSNTLENFANKVARETEPRLYVSLETHPMQDKKVIAISVRPPKQGELFYAFGVPYIRVGKTNQVMSPQEQRARLLQSQQDWAEERDRPRFDFPGGSQTNKPTEFGWARRIKRVAGDYVATIEWRFRGPRLQPPMEWRQVSGANLDSITLSSARRDHLDRTN